MKKILTLLLTQACILQYCICQTSTFHPRPELNKFVGTWINEENGHTITITLKKTIKTFKKVPPRVPNDNSIEFIEGTHSYRIGTTIIEESEKLTITLGTSLIKPGVADTNKITADFFDFTKGKAGEVTLSMVPGTNNNEIKWTLINHEAVGILVSGGKKFDASFTIPRLMILKRKK